MVLRLKTRESRSLPGLPRGDASRTIPSSHMLLQKHRPGARHGGVFVCAEDAHRRSRIPPPLARKTCPQPQPARQNPQRRRGVCDGLISTAAAHEKRADVDYVALSAIGPSAGAFAEAWSVRLSIEPKASAKDEDAIDTDRIDDTVLALVSPSRAMAATAVLPVVEARWFAGRRVERYKGEPPTEAAPSCCPRAAPEQPALTSSPRS
jgi:hypothetical protein